MTEIDLKYGRDRIGFAFDAERLEILGAEDDLPALTDVEIGEKTDAPIDSPPLEEIVNPHESVLIVVPDATRNSGCGQIVNLLVRRLIANGTMPHEIKIIFATGIHRPVTDDEKREILTPFIAQRLNTVNHHARDLMRAAGLESNLFVNYGETSGGISIELNRILSDFDHIITVGGVGFHYFAGFSGGRKLICPGLASAATIAATHKLAFDCEKKSRRTCVGTGILRGNAVHEVFTEIVKKIEPSFSFNTIVNDRGEIVELFCGDWQTAHEAGCAFYAARHTIKIKEKRDLVIVGCGGFPFDLNMIQAHKALEAAANACRDGGTIVFLAECADGLGRSDFLEWFAAANSAELAEKLCENYQVNGQTAWSLLHKAERFDIKIITNLTENETRPMRLHKARSIAEALAENDSAGYILPFGAKFLIEEQS